jgi:hypothetical protein
MHIPRQ